MVMLYTEKYLTICLYLYFKGQWLKKFNLKGKINYYYYTLYFRRKWRTDGFRAPIFSFALWLCIIRAFESSGCRLKSILEWKSKYLKFCSVKQMIWYVLAWISVFYSCFHIRLVHFTFLWHIVPIPSIAATVELSTTEVVRSLSSWLLLKIITEETVITKGP